MKRFDLGYVVLVLLLGLSLPRAEAAVSSLAVGYGMHTGPKQDSVAGASSFSGLLSTESEGRALRLSVGFEGHYGTAIMNYGGSEYSVERLGGQVRIGTLLRVFSDAALRPLIGVNGLVSIDIVRGPSMPAGLSESSFASGFGWEIEGGVALPWGASEIRFIGAYEKLSAKLGSRSIALDRVNGRMAFAF
jgi:hypothetical protein